LELERKTPGKEEDQKNREGNSAIGDEYQGSGQDQRRSFRNFIFKVQL